MRSFSAKNLIEIGLKGEKSHSKLCYYKSKGFCLSFSPNIHNFSSVLTEWDILSQNYPWSLHMKFEFNRHSGV